MELSPLESARLRLVSERIEAAVEVAASRAGAPDRGALAAAAREYAVEAIRDYSYSQGSLHDVVHGRVTKGLAARAVVRVDTSLPTRELRVPEPGEDAGYAERLEKLLPLLPGEVRRAAERYGVPPGERSAMERDARRAAEEAARNYRRSPRVTFGAYALPRVRRAIEAGIDTRAEEAWLSLPIADFADLAGRFPAPSPSAPFPAAGAQI